jgi:altronate dehydratase large subunit
VSGIDLTGYCRQGGRWGVRNHVLVLPARTASNTAVARIAAGMAGTVAVSHEWVGPADDGDTDLVLRTLAGFAANPNVAATLVVGVSDADAPLVNAIRARGGEASLVTMAAHGGTAGTVEAGRAQARALVAQAAVLEREPMPLSALTVGLECGGSDALSGITANPALGLASDSLVAEGASTVLSEIPELVGAEELLAARAISVEVADRIRSVIHGFERSVEALGVDVRGAQPTPGNIAGGLTTIEEKSLGAAKKAGSAPVSGVLEFAEPAGAPGLYIMDTPGHDIEQMVGLVAGGCQLIAFTTGRGTPTGSAIAPCLKIATNTAIYDRLEGDIDLNAGGIVDASRTLAEVGDEIRDALLAVARGRLTSSERRGHREFALRRIPRHVPPGGTSRLASLRVQEATPGRL